MVAEANGDPNTADRVWVMQQEYAQGYADCKQAGTCYANLKKAWSEAKEFAGWNDLKACRKHEPSGCVWLGVGWLPGGKLVKGGKLAADARRAAVAERVVLRSFTRSNFRENLARRTGGIPEGAEAHHVFPQKFAQQFEQRRINVNDPVFGAWWEKTVHRQSSGKYNREWEQFLRGNPNRDQVLDFGRSQTQRYGLKRGF
jgi:hypothetical protein